MSNQLRKKVKLRTMKSFIILFEMSNFNISATEMSKIKNNNAFAI